jgi:DNA-binding GntR family transcriptional regulator
VVNTLRERIVSGHLKPGDRLPTHHELEEGFQAGPPTIQDAMAVLREAGFIETRHRSGTFVAPHPPHLFSVLKGVSRFYEAIRDEAAKMQAPERRVLPFYEIESHADVDDYQRLLGFVRAHRLAGLIFAGDPYMLETSGSPLTQDPGVLRTAIMLPHSQFSFPTVYPDVTAFLPTAFDYLASRGRKRVAVVMLEGDKRVDLQAVQAMAHKRGLLLRPHWLQASLPIK